MAWLRVSAPQLWAHFLLLCHCVLALGYSLPLAGARPQVMLLSVFTAGQLAPQSQENHLKVLESEGDFLI